MSHASHRRLWVETVFGFAAGIFGAFAIARGWVPWYAGVGLVFFGGVYVNKLRAVGGIEEVGKVLRIWKWGNGASDG